MSKKSLVLHLVAHKGYFKHLDGDNVSKNQILFTAISQIYLPLLNMFANLESDGIPFKMGITITPTLCALLSDPVIQQNYIEWLDKLIALGELEATRYPENSEKYTLAKYYLKTVKRDKRDFIETFNQDILSKFSYYAKKGNVELFATTATFNFLPHISDFPEAVNAQIETGLISHKHFFDIAPEGFYLPHLGYTQGLEKNLKSYGINYTILDTHGLLFSHPEPELGIFSPVISSNTFAFFGRDSDTPEDISGETGFMFNPVYRNQIKDIGYDSSLSDLAGFLDNTNSRCPTVFRYWSNKESTDNLYNLEQAKQQIIQDAKSFLDAKALKLNKAEEIVPNKNYSLVCTLDTDLLGGSWYEGIDWLEQIFRQANERDDITIENCCDITKEQFTLQKVLPLSSASNGGGYGENLLDNTNDWMIKYLRKNTERMIDLAGRFTDDTGLKARSLNLAAKEVLLSQSSDLPEMLHNKDFPDYAKEQFIKTINGFSTVFESLGSNSISTEWLTNLEREHSLFPWINYKIFAKKK